MRPLHPHRLPPRPPLLTLCALATSLALGACGDFDIRDGLLVGTSYCEDIDGSYHFRVQIPPWKYNKEYKCSSVVDRQCVGTWSPTGRHVFVVSDIPFVNYDSEIVTILNVELTSGDPRGLARQLIVGESIGVAGSKAKFFGDGEYPTEVTQPEPALSGWEVIWRQEREFEGTSYDWHRRDVFLKGAGGRVYHLELYSIDSLANPEFDAIVASFREGPSPDGAPSCTCRDEHDPQGGVQGC